MIIDLIPEQILQQINYFNNSKVDVINTYQSDLNTEADGLIFLKPEVCSIMHNKLFIILEHLKKKFSSYSLNIHDIYLVSGQFLIENEIIENIYDKIKHYALISIVLNTKARGLTNNIKNNFKDYEAIMGGLALIEQGYSEEFLMELWSKSGTSIKIDEDCYGVPCFLENRKILLVNGFFPFQIKQYKKTGSKAIFFNFSTEESFSNLKKYFQGDADIKNRQQYSFRQFLFEFMGKHQLGRITTSCNGIHLSSSKEEGRREVNILTIALKKYHA